MSRDKLAVLWQRRWKRPPPEGLSRRMLEGNAAWQLQAEASSGLSAATRRRLESVAETAGSAGRRSPRKPPEVGDSLKRRRKLRPGNRLVRQWQGRSHVVEVIEGGFVYEGRQYTSLTSIARAITDTHWSGPRFFGLKVSAAVSNTGRGPQGPNLEEPRPEGSMERGDAGDG